MLTLNVALEVDTWNHFVGHSFWKMANSKKIWEKEIGLSLIIAKANGHFDPSLLNDKTKKSVHVIAMRRRRCDTDNLCLKPIMDALVRNNILIDDSLKWCDLKISQLKCGKQQPLTIIQIANVSN